MNYYEIDSRTENVLIRRLHGAPAPEILHKGDREWEWLVPGEDYKNERYCRAWYLGQGCWEDLDEISEEEAMDVLKQWGYTDDPQKAQ